MTGDSMWSVATGTVADGASMDIDGVVFNALAGGAEAAANRGSL